MPLESDPWITNDRERQAAFKNILLYGDIRDIILLARKVKIQAERTGIQGKEAAYR